MLDCFWVKIVFNRLQSKILARTLDEDTIVRDRKKILTRSLDKRSRILIPFAFKTLNVSSKRLIRHEIWYRFGNFWNVRVLESCSPHIEHVPYINVFVAVFQAIQLAYTYIVFILEVPCLNYFRVGIVLGGIVTLLNSQLTQSWIICKYILKCRDLSSWSGKKRL